MDSKDLMVGDWVNTNDGFRKVLIITPFRVRTNICEHEFDVDCITPISLTEDILKMNNFEFSPARDLALLKIGDVMIEVYPSDGLDWLRIYPSNDQRIQLSINYVHELQHALRLCGLNELADNFKIE